MKLSEILGWRKKDKIHLLFNGRYSQVALETALTSCDREIDREALWKLIVSRSVYHNFDSDKDNFITVPLNDLTDFIISTMPQWLKRIENGKI